MKTLLIVGAGASRAEAMAAGSTRAGLPPLDTDFFEIALQLAPSHEVNSVAAYLLTQYRIDVRSSTKPRMEDAFGLVYADTLTTPVPDGADKAFYSLCKMYNRVITETTNGIQVTQNGPIGQLVRSFIDADDLSIISFNQDLIVERAIVAVSKSIKKSLWYIDNGYAMDFNEHTLPTSASVESFELGGTTPSPIRVLKLHGSLNWYMKTRSKETVPAKLTNKISCTRRQKLTVDMRYKNNSSTGRKRWHTWPIIVPPIFEKGSYIGKALSTVWNSAFDAILNAERITVYGYSFPSADQQSQTFFRRAMANNNNKPLVSVINPNFQAAARANEILQPSSLILCQSAHELISLLQK